MNKNRTKTIRVLPILILLAVFTCGNSFADENLQTGSKYQIKKPIYLMAVYNSLNNKIVSRETAQAYLHSEKYYQKSTVAFQKTVPPGTIMTILGPAPKVWHIPFFAKRYFVQLEPNISEGVEVILELNRGMEGKLNGLNPDLFSRDNE